MQKELRRHDTQVRKYLVCTYCSKIGVFEQKWFFYNTQRDHQQTFIIVCLQQMRASNDVHEPGVYAHVRNRLGC